jgi:hypothetical protein
MASFCGFCGSKAIDDRSKFCADCGGKLELSVEAQTPSHTMPLPALTPAKPAPSVSEPNVVLSRSFANLLSQEASIGKEISPIAASELSRSFLESVSSPSEEQGLLGDTLQEVKLDQLPPKSPVVTLPDFLSPASIPAAAPTPTIETAAPVNKIPRVHTPSEPAEAIDRDTLEDSPKAVRATEAKSGAVPKENDPNILLSNSIEEIIIKEKREKERPKSIAADLSEMKIAPVKPLVKLELPPKSVLLSEPSSVISDGFAERLAKEPFANFFSVNEAGRALRSPWGQAVIVLFMASLFMSLRVDIFSFTKNIGLGSLFCLFFFRLLAEERQALWRFLSFFFGALFASAALLSVIGGATSRLEFLMLSAGFGSLLSVSAVFLGWFLQPRWKTMEQPIDGVLLGLFGGAAFGSALSGGLVASQALTIISAEALCGGLSGYWLGLSWFRQAEQQRLWGVAVIASLLLRVVFWLLLPSMTKSALVGLILTLLLCAGYLLLLGFVIKLKQLERN